ncbi:MAG: rod shape-determining protein MreD [Clostridia bacterium]
MSRKFKFIFMTIVVLLQATVLAHFTPFSVLPNYTLVALLSVTVQAFDDDSIPLAIFTGLLTDVISGAILGLGTLLCLYTVISWNLITEMIYEKRMIIISPIVFVLSFLYELLFGVFSCLIRGVSFVPQAILSTVLPVSVINAIIFIPVCICIGKVHFEKKGKGIRYEQ